MALGYTHVGRRDANEPEIVKALRAVGAEVFLVVSVPSGFPDLVVRFRGEVKFMEVKVPGAKLRPAQQRFQHTWESDVVESVDDALQAIGAVGTWKTTTWRILPSLISGLKTK